VHDGLLSCAADQDAVTSLDQALTEAEMLLAHGDAVEAGDLVDMFARGAQVSRRASCVAPCVSVSFEESVSHT
jgi:hypothetical protein